MLICDISHFTQSNLICRKILIYNIIYNYIILYINTKIHKIAKMQIKYFFKTFVLICQSMKTKNKNQ